MPASSYLLSGQPSKELIPRHSGALGIDQHGIQVIRVTCSLLRLRWKCQREVAKFPLVAGPYCLTALPVCLDAAQLMQADRGLNVHHVVLVAALDDVIVFVARVAESPPRVFVHAVQSEDPKTIRIVFAR